MSVNTSALGPYSAKITYTAGESLANVMSAVDAWLTAHGWTLYDAAAGSNAKCYEAPNADGVTYKYIVLDFNTAGYILMKTYETWDVGAHSGTNMCYNSDNTAYAQRVDLAGGGDIYIFAAAQWCAIQTSISAGVGSSTGNAWCGCFEFTRDNPEDTGAGGYPCFVWTNGYLISANITGVAAFPRIYFGNQTGINAFNGSMLSTALTGMLGMNQSLGQVMPTAVYLWNNKNWALTLRIGSNGPDIRGRLYGLKMTTKNIGGFMDTMNIKVNADFFYDVAGTLQLHSILSETTNNTRIAIPQ
jgi:hypothetical protein